MEQESYCECLISHRTERKKQIRLAATALAMAVCILIGLVWNVWVWVGAVLFGVLTWHFWQTRRCEYEYLVLDREITVDAIYNRSRRKSLLRCPIRKVILFVPESSPKFDEYRNTDSNIHDFSSGRPEDCHYVLVCKNDQGTLIFRLTPNEEMLDELSWELPGRIFSRA